MLFLDFYFYCVLAFPLPKKLWCDATVLFYLAWKIYCFRYNSWWIGWNLNIILYLRFNWLSIKLSATNLLTQSHSDVKWRFMYQNWPSKSVTILPEGPRSLVSVPEPIGTPSDDILHRSEWPDFVVISSIQMWVNQLRIIWQSLRFSE